MNEATTETIIAGNSLVHFLFWSHTAPDILWTALVFYYAFMIVKTLTIILQSLYDSHLTEEISISLHLRYRKN